MNNEWNQTYNVGAFAVNWCLQIIGPNSNSIHYNEPLNRKLL